MGVLTTTFPSFMDSRPKSHSPIQTPQSNLIEDLHPKPSITLIASP